MLITNKKYIYTNEQYIKFVQYVLQLEEDLDIKYGPQVDSLQQYAQQVRNAYTVFEKILDSHKNSKHKNHVNHSEAFDHLEQALQYQLDCIDELCYYTVTKAPLLDNDIETHLQTKIEKAEKYATLLKTHFELETHYAELKDDKKEAELNQKEKWVKELREIMSKFNEKFKKFTKPDAKPAEHLKELDDLVEQYEKQKAVLDALEPAATTAAQPNKKDPKKAEKDKEDKKQKKEQDGKSSSKPKKAITLRSVFSSAKSVTKQAAHTLAAAPTKVKDTASSAVQNVVSLVTEEKSIDRNTPICVNGVQDHDTILLDKDKQAFVNPVSIQKYINALQTKIRELDARLKEAFSEKEKPLKLLAEQLLKSARDYLAKIETHKESHKIGESVSTEKAAFMKAFDTYDQVRLFPQQKQLNLTQLKRRISDLESEKRLIKKLSTKNCKENQKKLFGIMKKYIKEIEKARKKIKNAKTFQEIKTITDSLTTFKDTYKAAKAEFDKFLSATTPAPVYTIKDAKTTALNQGPAASNNSTTTGSSPTANRRQEDNSATSSTKIDTDSDHSDTGSDINSTGSGGSETSVEPLSAGSHLSFNSQSSNRLSEDEEKKPEEALILELRLKEEEARILELREKEEKGKKEAQELVAQIQQLEEAARKKEEASLAAELAAVKQQTLEVSARIEGEARRTAELAAQRAREEKARKDEEARQAAEAEKKKRAEEARRAAEAEKKKREEDAQRAAEAEEKKRTEEVRVAEAQEKKRAERARRIAEAKEKKHAEEARRIAEAKEKKHAEEARRIAEAEENKRAEEARRIAEAEENKRAEEARRIAEAEEKKHAEEARRIAEAEENKRAEEARRIAEAEENKRAEEVRRIAEAEENKRAEEVRRIAEAEENKRAEEVRRIAEAEENKRAEEVRRIAEAEENKRAEEVRRIAEAEKTRQEKEQQARRTAELESERRAREENAGREREEQARQAAAVAEEKKRTEDARQAAEAEKAQQRRDHEEPRLVDPLVRNNPKRSTGLFSCISCLFSSQPKPEPRRFIPNPDETQDAINRLSKDNAINILDKLGSRLLEGAIVDNKKEPYEVSFFGSDYVEFTINDVQRRTIKIPKTVASVINKINLALNDQSVKSKSANASLIEVYNDFLTAARSRGFTRYDSTQKFYESVLPEFIENAVKDARGNIFSPIN